jgi:ubiquinone/menaquinone biosynthesis C-methylase UbiE
MSYAFDDLFPKSEFIVNVEPSDAMRKLGKYISQEHKQVTWVSSLSETLRFDKHQYFDVVSICNVLEEIPTPEGTNPS